MTNVKLKEYIKQQLQNDIDFEVIKNTLINKGWNESIIINAYNELNSFSVSETKNDLTFNQIPASQNLNLNAFNKRVAGNPPNEDRLFNEKNLLILIGSVIFLTVFVAGVSFLKLSGSNGNEVSEKEITQTINSLSLCDDKSDNLSKNLCYLNIFEKNTSSEVCNEITDTNLEKACEKAVEDNLDKKELIKSKITPKVIVWAVIFYIISFVFVLLFQALFLLWALKINKIFEAAFETALKIVFIASLLGSVLKLTYSLINLFLPFNTFKLFLAVAFLIISIVYWIAVNHFLFKKYFDTGLGKNIIIMLTIIAIAIIFGIALGIIISILMYLFFMLRMSIGGGFMM